MRIVISRTRDLLWRNKQGDASVLLGMKGSIAMWKKLLMASAITGLLAAVAIPLETTSADASRSGCREAAKAKFFYDPRTRKEYRRYCKQQWKVYKSAHGGSYAHGAPY